MKILQNPPRPDHWVEYWLENVLRQNATMFMDPKKKVSRFARVRRWFKQNYTKYFRKSKRLAMLYDIEDLHKNCDHGSGGWCAFPLQPVLGPGFGVRKPQALYTQFHQGKYISATFLPGRTWYLWRERWRMLIASTFHEALPITVWHGDAPPLVNYNL